MIEKGNSTPRFQSPSTTGRMASDLPFSRGDGDSCSFQNDRNHSEFLEQWLTQCGLFENVVLRPRLTDGASESRSPDALARGHAIGWCVIDVWWHDDLPRRDPRTHLLERLMGGFPVACPDPSVRLTSTARLIMDKAEAMGIQCPPLRLILLLPSAKDHAKQLQIVLQVDNLVVLGGTPPDLASLLNGPPQSTKFDYFTPLWEWACRRPGEIARDATFRARANASLDRAQQFLSRVGYNKKAREMQARRASPRPLTIALVGTFTSAKTTLLNCLTGPYLFPATDLPTTAMRVEASWGKKVDAEVSYRGHASLKKYWDFAKEKLGRLRTKFDPNHPRAGTRRRVSDWDELSELIQSTDQSVYVSDVQIRLPIPLLKDVTLVDLPGTDSHEPWHQEVVEQALERVDAFIYCFNASKPFDSADRRLLQLVSARHSLSATARFLFLASYADLVPAAERLTVGCYIEAQLERQFGIDRPRVLLACPILGEARFRLSDRSAGHQGLDEYEYTYQDALESFHLNANLPPESAFQYSGVPSVVEWIKSVANESEAWRTRSWLETAYVLVEEAGTWISTNQKGFECEIEHLRKTHADIVRQKEKVALELRDRVANARLNVKAKERIREIVNAGDLHARWDAVIKSHTGDAGQGRAKLEGTMREWGVYVQDQVNKLIEESNHQVALAANAVADAVASEVHRVLTEGQPEEGLSISMEVALNVDPRDLYRHQTVGQEVITWVVNQWPDDTKAWQIAKGAGLSFVAILAGALHVIESMFKGIGDLWAEIRGLDAVRSRLSSIFNSHMAREVVKKILEQTEIREKEAATCAERFVDDRIAMLEHALEKAIARQQHDEVERTNEKQGLDRAAFERQKLLVEIQKLIGEL